VWLPPRLHVAPVVTPPGDMRRALRAPFPHCSHMVACRLTCEINLRDALERSRTLTRACRTSATRLSRVCRTETRFTRRRSFIAIGWMSSCADNALHAPSTDRTVCLSAKGPEEPYKLAK